MTETLKREIKEELNVEYTAKPKQLMAFLTSISIPYGDASTPLIFVVYEVKLPKNANIELDRNSYEEGYDWFTPKRAAKEMKFKFDKDFCDLVSNLKP